MVKLVKSHYFTQHPWRIWILVTPESDEAGDFLAVRVNAGEHPNAKYRDTHVMHDNT